MHQLWVHRGTVTRRKTPWALLLPIALVATMYFGPQTSEVMWYLVAVFVIMPAIVWLAISTEMPGQILWKKLGDLSFPLYCIHQPILQLVPDDPYIRLAAGLATIPLALAADHFYDRHARAWLGGLARRKKPAAAILSDAA